MIATTFILAILSLITAAYAVLSATHARKIQEKDDLPSGTYLLKKVGPGLFEIEEYKHE